MTGAPLRVALHTGVLFDNDAISNSLVEKLDAVADARREGKAVEALALVSSSEVDRPDVAVVGGAAGVLEHPWFWEADVHVYEYGIWYEGFDTVFVVPPSAARVAVYHNVTPPEFAQTEQSRLLLERSCGKKANLSAFDHIMCDSEYNRLELVERGIDPGRLSVVPLPPACDTDHPRRSPQPDEPVRLFYVGRFVAAKGVTDLLEAARLAVTMGADNFRLRLAGNQSLSEPAVLAEMERLAATPELASRVEMAGDVTDDELAALYATGDALVMPSYHEGYCVPVVEAVSAGAHVLTSDAGNLPYITKGVGRTVPAGDVDALAKALADLVDRLTRARRGEPLEVMTDDGPVDEETWRARVEEHRQRHSRAAFRQGFWDAVAKARAGA